VRPTPAKSGHAGCLRNCSGGAQSKRGRARRGDEDHARTLVTCVEGGGMAVAWDVGARGRQK
jgi:hypothetical protein